MTDYELQRLTDDANRLLRENEPFLRGDDGHEEIDEEVVAEYVEELPSEYTDGETDLKALDDGLREIVNDFDEFEGEMDSEAAVAVREHVNLTRAQAADHGIWHDLCIRKFPWFVRYRWDYTGETGMKKKFWTYGVALDSQSCTFERLWWIAELTRRPDGEGGWEYTRTRRAFEARRFVFRVFDIQMGRYGPAASALVDTLYDEDGGEDGDGKFASNDVIDDVVQRFRKSGSTMPFEGRDQADLVDAIEQIREDVDPDFVA